MNNYQSNMLKWEQNGWHNASNICTSIIEKFCTVTKFIEKCSNGHNSQNEKLFDVGAKCKTVNRIQVHCWIYASLGRYVVASHTVYLHFQERLMCSFGQVICYRNGDTKQSILVSKLSTITRVIHWSQNGWNYTDRIFKCTSVGENVLLWFNFSSNLKYKGYMENQGP